MGIQHRGGGPQFDGASNAMPMAQTPTNYTPNTVAWAGRGSTFAPNPPGAVDVSPATTTPTSAQIGNQVLTNPIVSTFQRAKGG